MANIAVTPQQIDNDGMAATYQTPNTSDTYQVPHTDQTFLHVKKSGANPCTVTVQTPATAGGLTVGERTVVVPATTGDVMIGPFPAALFRDSDGKLNVTFSEVTGLSFGAFRL